MNLRTMGTLLCLALAPLLLPAQSIVVRLESTEARLYRGYVNPIQVVLRHDSDTVNRYIFHATAIGATLDYSNDGKVFILPTDSVGQVKVYAEVNGLYYEAGQFRFKAVNAPPLTDGTFVQSMGITKDNPKTKLSRKTIFNPKGKNIKVSALVTISGFPMNGLRAERNEVKAIVFERTKDSMIPRRGTVRIETSDAKIEALPDDVLAITPLPGKKRCLLTFYFEGKKVGEEWWTVDDSVR